MTSEEYQEALARQQRALEREERERAETMRWAEEIAQIGQPIPGTNYIPAPAETVTLPDGSLFTRARPPSRSS